MSVTTEQVHNMFGFDRLNRQDQGGALRMAGETVNTERHILSYIAARLKHYDRAEVLPECLVDVVAKAVAEKQETAKAVPEWYGEDMWRDAMRLLTLSVMENIVGWNKSNQEYEEHLDELAEYMDERYLGMYRDRKEFAEDQIEDWYPNLNECDCCPKHLDFYVDWDTWARDRSWEGVWSCEEVHGWEFWFRDS